VSTPPVTISIPPALSPSAWSKSVDADKRSGICLAGNWIIDHVKTIDAWPQEETLATILTEELGTGGAPYNVSVDLARFGVRIPLSALGLVGEDADGDRIIADCQKHGIDTRWLRRISTAPTAYTDVMSVRGTGRRTFFHHRGANALLSPEHFPMEELHCRILTLGYLLLLDSLDDDDPEFGTAAARVLARARAAGIHTAVDVVSENSDRFQRIVTPALPHVDYLIINEIEAGRTVGIDLRPGSRLDCSGVEEAAQRLLDAGVHRWVVIHAAEAAFGRTRDGLGVWKGSFELPKGFIAGTVGAGDAFFAGILVGIHEGWSLGDTLLFANGAAATCLRHPTCTGGVGTVEEIRDLLRTYPVRSLIDGSCG
jgi:sugar/nucleoside kinase (ribokinase family)